MSREVEEWVGKTDDTPLPPRVKERLLRKYNFLCGLTGAALVPGSIEFDHIIPLCNGGENREGNFHPVGRKAHKVKTAADVRQKAKNSSVVKRHWGLNGVKRPVPGSKASPWKKHLDGRVTRRDGGAV
jgi:5-methylcytosine-specific restriction protein A